MNTLKRLGAAGGIGLAVYLTGPASVPVIDPYPSATEMNERAEACAVQLGGAAAVVEEVPAPCRAYAYQEPFEPVTSRNGEPRFDMPSADTFLAHRMVDEDEYNSQQNMRRVVFGSIAGGTAVAVYVVLTGFDRRMRRSEEDD